MIRADPSSSIYNYAGFDKDSCSMVWLKTFKETFESNSLYTLHIIHFLEDELLLCISSLIFFSNGPSSVASDDAVVVLGIIFAPLSFKMVSGKGSTLAPKHLWQIISPSLTFDFRDD